MEQSSKDLLKIGVERGYLDHKLVREIIADSRLRKVSPERILLERRILSVRRLERLRTHLSYRTMRKSDKLYSELAVNVERLSPEQVADALKHQKKVFSRRRECVRVGAYLIEQGVLSVDEDRDLRTRLAGREASQRSKTPEPSSAATLPLHEESAIKSSTKTSYRAIEAALERVEAIRAIQQELSTSDNVAARESQRLGPDSAAEFENACSLLARRRVKPEAPAPVKKRRRRAKKKSTGAFLTALFNKSVA